MSRSLVLIGLLLAATASTARAQEDELPMLGWVSAGLGVTSVGFVAGSANATVQIRSLVVSLRATDNTQQLFGGDEVADVGLLVGVGTPASQPGHVTVAAGLARLSGHRSTSVGWFAEQRSPIGPTLGFPLEAQVFVGGANFAIGAYIYADINAQRSFAGMTLSLEIGELR